MKSTPSSFIKAKTSEAPPSRLQMLTHAETTAKIIKETAG